MATYLDNAGVTQILTKIKSLLAKKAEITAIPTKVSQLTNDRQFQNVTEVDDTIYNSLHELAADSSQENGFTIVSDVSAKDLAAVYLIKQEDGKISGKLANLGDAITGRVSELTNSYLATQSYVSTSVSNAVGKITSFEYKIVSSLPSTTEGKKGVIYLVAHSGSTTNNVYDEYIFLPAEGSTAARYEKIGTTDIDLTPYAKKTEIPTKVSQLSNDLSLANTTYVSNSISTAVNALEKSDTAETGKYVSAVSQKNGVITVTRASLPAVGTADTPISNTTIESIFTQVFG